MEPNLEQHSAQSGAELDQENGLLATLLSSAPSLLNRYKTQWAAIQQMLSLEWKLTLKSGLFILVSLMILSCVLLSTWVGFNVLLAYGLLAIDTPVWAVVLAVLFFHLLVLAGLLRAIKLLVAEMGFKQTLSAFGSADPLAKEEEA